jgi:nitrogen regulatory protein PII
MRLVVAILKPSQVESVRQSLAAVHVTRLTICDAHGYDLAVPDSLAQEAVMEIAVNDDFLDRTVATIAAALEAGGIDSGSRLFVLPMEEAVQIYRTVHGPEAI